MKHFDIYEPVFKCIVYLVLTPSEGSFVKYIKDTFKIEAEGVDEDSIPGASHGMFTVKD